MKLNSFLVCVGRVAAQVLVDRLPGVPVEAHPLFEHAIDLAEHALDAQGKPLDGPTKNQLATEALKVGFETLDKVAVAKGGHAVAPPVDVDALSGCVSEIVDAANAVHAAVQSMSSKVAQSSSVALATPDALVVARSTAQVAQRKAALLG